MDPGAWWQETPPRHGAAPGSRSDPLRGQVLDSCTLLVTAANDWMKPIHDRMPVILLAHHQDLWLDPAIETAAPLQPLPPCWMP